jgi:hypothetical protein
MTTRFLVLCTLDVTHVYYGGGACRDFTFVAPADTGAVLRRGRLLMKTLDGRLYILFEADDNDAPLTPIPGAVLRIGLHATNTAFVNFTALTFAPGPEVAVYTNGAGNAQLGAATTAIPTGRLLTRTLTQAARPVTVTVTNAVGPAPATATITAALDRPDVSFDFGAFRPGLYTVTESYPNNVTHAATYYFDPELAREPLVGVVEIAIASAFYANPPSLAIAFDAKAETLKYYVVARDYTDPEFDQIGVSQFVAQGQPEITFTRKLPAAFAASDLSPALLASGGAKLALFHSDAPVKRRAGGYARVQLSRNGEVIISNLPQVTADRTNADVIVHLSKPKP